MGVVAVVVQGVLLQRLLMRWLGARRLVLIGLTTSSTVANLIWASSTEGWMMVGAIFLNIARLGRGRGDAGPRSPMPPTPRTQGETMGAVAAISSLMAVIAPMIGGLRLMALVAAASRPTGASARRSTSARCCNWPRWPRVAPLHADPPAQAAAATASTPRRRLPPDPRHPSIPNHPQKLTMHDKILILDFGSQVTQLDRAPGA